jgi:hypothetical protein
MHLEDASYSCRATWQYWSVAVFAVLHWETASGRTKRRASLIICIPELRRFHIFSCHSTPGRRGHIRHITWRHWLLRPSQCCDSFPRLTIGATTTRVARGRSVSIFCLRYGMDLGPLCYTGSSMSARRATFDDPDLTACHFGSSLKQPRMAGFAFTVLASVQLLRSHLDRLHGVSLILSWGAKD